MGIKMPRKYRYEKKVRAMFCIENRGHHTPCWIWKRALNGHGYAIRGHNGFRTQLVYLQFWQMINGSVAEGLELDHICRQRDCVRPDHLEPVTSQENTRRGFSTKLTISQVEEIRRLRNTGIFARTIGEQFGISKTHVLRICKDRAWRK